MTDIEVIELYTGGLSVLQIESKYNISRYVCYRILHKNNVPIRKNGANWQKYSCNENYFETIDTEEKAYWLGFIMADGYVVSNKNQFGVTLSSRDRNHLMKLRNALEANHAINDYENDTVYKKNTKYSRLIISSKKLKEDLISHGIKLQKTLVTKYPNIDSSLDKHFIRGYFDGDGSISKHNKKSGNKIEYQFKLCGTKEILTTILNKISFSKAKLFERNYDGKNNFYISIGGNNQVLNILTYLYDNNSICLKRKEKRYLELQTQQSS